MYSFLDLESVCFSISGSNCCFLTCIQISQEAGKVVWYSHLFKNVPQFLVSHTVKGFGVVIKQVFFWNSLTFSVIQWMLAIWSLVLLPFPKPAWTSESSQFTYCWSLAWRILSITLQACESEVTQSCPTLCDPMDYSPPGSSIHEILQARVLEWVAISFSNKHVRWVQLCGSLSILWHCLS